MRQLLLSPLVLVFVLAPGCCCTKSSTRVVSPYTPVKVEGFEYSFSYPRADILPGSLVVRWENSDAVTAVCIPGRDYAGSQALSRGGPVSYQEGAADTLKSDLEAKAKSAFEAKFSGSKVSNVKIKMTIYTSTDSDTTTTARQATESCRDKAKFIWAHNRELKFFSIVSSVVEFDLDYEIQLDSAIDISAGLDKSVLDTLGAGGQASYKDESHKTIQIHGAKLVPQYNLDKNLQLPPGDFGIDPAGIRVGH